MTAISIDHFKIYINVYNHLHVLYRYIISIDQ